MVDIEEELGEGDIHLRDKYQFELKSEYCPVAGRVNNTYTLEFYFFIPSSLHINKATYTKKHFYYDQTSLLRQKTPSVPLKELIASNTKASPLFRIRKLYEDKKNPGEQEVLTELKLYANSVRSVVRDWSQILSAQLKHPTSLVPLSSTAEDIQKLCLEISALRASYLNFMKEFHPTWQDSHLEHYARYIDEFLSVTVQSHLTPLIKELQSMQDPVLLPAKETIYNTVLWETNHRDTQKEKSPFADDPERSMEYFVYRTSLLKKFVWEVLFLNVIRKEPSKPFREFVAIVAAGIAMLFYLYFLTLQAGGIFINSTTFIIIAVLLYIVKDRLKDGIKNASASWAQHWFPDYSTDIETTDGEAKLGQMKEYFGFVTPDHIPIEILTLRNTGFHTELEKAERMENIFYYRKTVTLFAAPEDETNGLHRELNDIFRYNISRFLLKASDAQREHLEIDEKSGGLRLMRAPKVYHINIILRRTFRDADDQPVNELRKYRVVLDKEGILRIEKVL
jgi:hypothetical protein